MVVVEVHEEAVEVGPFSLEALLDGIVVPVAFFARDLADVAQDVLTPLAQNGHMHAVLGRVLRGHRRRQVARRHDVLYLGVTLRQMCHEVHLLPAVLFFTGDPREAEALQLAPLHEIDSSVWVAARVLAGFE